MRRDPIQNDGQGESMPGMANGKLRILYIMRMLQEETDAARGLSMSEIIRRLADCGMTADRKTIYTDLDTLRAFGLVIKTVQRNPVEYFIENRDFELSELMLIVDAVQSCKFITQKQCDRISRNVRLLATDYQREKLARRIHVDGRVKNGNDKTFESIDAIHEALRLKRKVTFTYWKIGPDGKMRIQHEGKPYEVTPVRITFSNEYYYLTAWSDVYEDMAEYRIDRMRDVMPSEEKATQDSRIGNYEFTVRDSQYFGRFDGELMRVTFCMSEDMLGAVHDRFGNDAVLSIDNEGRCLAQANVRVSPQFFGWVAGLGGKVNIFKPAKLKDAYRTYLQSLIES